MTLFGAVIVEQASAYWGQLWEPCLLQSFSLDATHLWHFSALPGQGWLVQRRYQEGTHRSGAQL